MKPPKEFSRQICTVINKELGIEMERIFLNFSEIERTNWVFFSSCLKQDPKIQDSPKYSLHSLPISILGLERMHIWLRIILFGKKKSRSFQKKIKF